MKKKTRKTIKPNPNALVIYQTKTGAIELRGDIRTETLWATQAQIADVFAVDRTVITKHIKNIFATNELKENSVCAFFAHTASDGKTYQTKYYNLDTIISVGYRVNSLQATQFRIWATKTLREYLIKGYTLNKKVILKNYDQFIKTVSDMQALLPAHIILDPKTVLDLVKEYASTWTKLNAYDHDVLKKEGATKKKVKLQGQELMDSIIVFKSELLKKKEATDIFAQERTNDVVIGIIGNVMQSFGGKELYPSLEEKAAHLLYFIVKNHPFIDGNKRSGAFAFIWFLRKLGVKGAYNINPSGLTALTLLIAESDPKQKDKMVALVVELLRVGKK